MKKSLLIISIIMAVIIAGITTVQAATATAELKTDKTTAKPGDTFAVTLYASCDEGINGVFGGTSENDYKDYFEIKFDDSKLELLSKEILKLADLNDSEEKDKVSLMTTGSSVKADDLVKFNFKVKDSAALGETQISTTDLLINADNEGNEDIYIPVGKKSVTVTVANDSTTPSEGGEEGQSGGSTGDGGESQGSGSAEDGKGSQGSDSTEDGKGSQGSGSTQPGNGGKVQTITGKTPDNSTAKTILPAAGSFALRGLTIIALAIVSLVTYKKYAKYKEIK